MDLGSDFEAGEWPFVAAIHHDGTTDTDLEVSDFAGRRRRAARRVLGLLMHCRDCDAGCPSAMVLTDID